MTETITQSMGSISLAGSRKTAYCLVDHEDPLVQPLIVAAFRSRLPQDSYKIITSISQYPGGPLLQICAKDALDFDKAFHQPLMLISTYVNRDALTRKSLLGKTYANWIAKNPNSLLKTNVKAIADLEIQSSESIYDVLDDTPLGEALQTNEDKTPAERVWWMLRPDMSGGSQDLRLISTVDELQAAFDEWDSEPSAPHEDDRTKEHSTGTSLVPGEQSTPGASHGDEDHASAEQSGGWSSWFQITVTTEEYTDEVAPKRHVIAQRYVSRPLTFASRKFQVSAYVLAVGALRVYVYRPMVALFATSPFRAPWETSAEDDLSSHSTFDGHVREFWNLPDVPSGWKASVFSQICDITGEVFSAAATREMKAHFQPLPQSFELFSVNFAVDDTGRAMLSDIRASPDFLHQTECGAKLEGMVEGLFEEVAEVAVKPFFDGENRTAKTGNERLVKVVDIDAKRI
ncbi:hypothetical protein SLS56_009158 [Neofusicoccum ribis]|uniref:Tubulin-tyrosine ligase n=1 Tax=Neofusicoccum ribis TaxID=45134 RepID=A0ABR3SI49_9PEZI